MSPSRRRVLAGAAAVAGTAMGGGMFAGTARADYTTVVDPRTTWGSWEGWGTCLSWWTNVFGENDTLADLFFTDGTVSFQGKEYPGLGFTIARMNVGACAWNTIDGASMQESPYIWRYKQLEGYWLDWASDDPASASFDWSVDAEQRAMVAKAADRGVDTFELFSCSPMWWMCANHNPSGADDGGDNLQSWNYQQHARYLAIVAAYARDNWGIEFGSVDPFNEPSANWWRPDNERAQEGCHVSRSVQETVIGHLRAELDARGLDGVLVAASDENSYQSALDTWTSFADSTKNAVGRVNVHGYQYGEGPRAELYEAVAGKPIWQTEYGDGTDNGLEMAYNISRDLRSLHPTAWVYWQAVDGYTWGLVKSTYTDQDAKVGTLDGVNRKYHVMAQYSRHVQPGMTILDSGDQATVAAYDETAGRLVLVTIRGDSDQAITYDLSAFGRVDGDGGKVRRWSTDIENGTELYAAHHDDTVLEGKSFTVPFSRFSVQTFEIDNVAL